MGTPSTAPRRFEKIAPSIQKSAVASTGLLEELRTVNHISTLPSPGSIDGIPEPFSPPTYSPPPTLTSFAEVVCPAGDVVEPEELPVPPAPTTAEPVPSHDDPPLDGTPETGPDPAVDGDDDEDGAGVDPSVMFTVTGVPESASDAKAGALNPAAASARATIAMTGCEARRRTVTGRSLAGR